jgi:hypothetical protein
MDEEQQLRNLLYKTNKEITRLKYEGELFSKLDIKEMIETLQHHIFLVHTFIDKPEFTTSDVKAKLLEKLQAA